MRTDPSKRLTILSEAEKLALYGLPDFDDFQRAEYFALTDAERALVHQRKGLSKQVYCLLQIGHFKAKQAFFKFSWQEGKRCRRRTLRARGAAGGHCVHSTTVFPRNHPDTATAKIPVCYIWPWG